MMEGSKIRDSGDGHVTSPAGAEGKEEGDRGSVKVNAPRFYFESDALALKNNPDYCQLLKTLAVLEAQKMQAIRDVEMLLNAQTQAEADPLSFIQSLKDGTLEPLPKRQMVAELPDIEWKPYIDSLQLVAQQHSFINTRRHCKPFISSLDEKSVFSKPAKGPKKPATFGQQWTREEQTKFEELLKVYPPEHVERRRFEKIARALGTRTTQQVATHAQKYFIKLASAGLPVPGRMPNIYKYNRKKGKGKRSLKRPSTFFSALTPHVLMKEEAPSINMSMEAAGYEDSDDESISSEFVSGGHEEEEEGETSGSSSPSILKCVKCECDIQQGVYWQCSECPETTPTYLCNECINSDYNSQCHSPSHNMHLLSLAPPRTYFGDGGPDEMPSTFVDKDYINFGIQNSETGYNYLDPNFFPAS